MAAAATCGAHTLLSFYRSAKPPDGGFAPKSQMICSTNTLEVSGLTRTYARKCLISRLTGEHPEKTVYVSLLSHVSFTIILTVCLEASRAEFLI